MGDKKSTQISNSFSLDENDCVSPDVVPIDTDINEIVWHNKNLMSDPHVGEELLEDSVLKAMEQFLYVFTDRYPTSGPTLYMGNLDQALAHSLFNPTNPCPLVLFVYHNQSVATNVFCEQVLCTEEITNCLADNFIVWAWDRTSEINYQRLLTMLRINLDDNVVETVASSPIDLHPILICLGFTKGHVEIIAVIQGSMSSPETLTLLIQARDAFDRRDEIPDPTGLRLTPVANEGWSISPSTLISIERRSEEFQKVAHDFAGDSKRILSIEKIENPLWLFQYLKHKERIDDQFKDGESERLLVFHCPEAITQQILQRGFNNNLKSIHGRKYGYGFYFSSPSVHPQDYNSRKKTIVVCRVLVGRTCLGNWMMETCPDGYDSTTDESDTYVNNCADRKCDTSPSYSV